jgi:cytochrome bd-type quinol oxidase subunit 1
MFSRGQIIFALFFFVCFVVGIALAYRKDKHQNSDFFKGSYKVLLVIVGVFLTLYGVVKLKHFL